MSHIYNIFIYVFSDIFNMNFLTCFYLYVYCMYCGTKHPSILPIFKYICLLNLPMTSPGGVANDDIHTVSNHLTSPEPEGAEAEGGLIPSTWKVKPPVNHSD